LSEPGFIGLIGFVGNKMLIKESSPPGRLATHNSTPIENLFAVVSIQ